MSKVRTRMEIATDASVHWGKIIAALLTAASAGALIHLFTRYGHVPANGREIGGFTGGVTFLFLCGLLISGLTRCGTKNGFVIGLWGVLTIALFAWLAHYGASL